MKSVRLFPVLRALAAKSPVTPVQKAAKVFFAAIVAVTGALVANAPMACAQAVTFTGAGAVNFGTANVCPSGKTVPAPCSQTLSLTYNVTASGTLGTPQALTTGQPNLDYKLAGGSTCSGSVIKGNTCKVNVTFAPITPGARNGAVEIVDTSGNVLATTYIYGTGTGPLVSFGPPAQRNINIGAELEPASIAVDASGNLFVAGYDEGGRGLLEEVMAVDGVIPPDPVVKTLLSNDPQLNGSIAIDGAGNVLFTEVYELKPGVWENTVEEILAASGYSTTKTIIGTDDYYGQEVGIAIDGSGNLFVADQGFDCCGPSYVEEFFAASDYSTTKKLGGGFSFEGGVGPVALDANGDVFVQGYVDPEFVILEMSASNDYTTVRTINVSPQCYCGFAVDAAGNLFISGGEILAVDGVVPSNPTVLPLNITNGFALDGHGNLYMAGEQGFDIGTGYYGQVAELQFVAPPPLAFATTAIGQTSSDSPQSIQIQNQGNATLDLSALSVSTSWDIVPGSGAAKDCTAGSSLVPSALCDLAISFKPTETGVLTGEATLTDNSLNAPGATQPIPLSGTSVPLPSPPHVSSLNWTYGAPYSVVILYGTNFGATQGSSTVTFNGIATPHYYWANTKIYVTVPPNATTGNLVVTVDGEASNAIPFTILPMPKITGISPTSGPVGTVVTISGNNLLDYENKGTVTFNGKSLPILSQSSTALQVAVPTGAVTDHFHVLVNDTGMNTSTFSVTP